jgi:hypothetical protein
VQTTAGNEITKRTKRATRGREGGKREKEKEGSPQIISNCLDEK